jgi:hypothetical protein
MHSLLPFCNSPVKVSFTPVDKGLIGLYPCYLSGTTYVPYMYLHNSAGLQIHDDDDTLHTRKTRT